MNDAISHESRPVQKGHALRDELPVIRPELSWTHYRLLMKVERPDVRKFYLDECIAASWSTRQLERQINSFYYERLLSSQDKGRVRAEIRKLEPGPGPHDIIRDPYVLEFLGLKENKAYLENELEQGLIDKLHDFLLELGKGFSFVARQKRITIDSDHFYIDLIFYNYILKCFVLIDLKVGEEFRRDNLLRMLVDVQYERNDIDFHRGTFRVRGDVVTLPNASGQRKPCATARRD